MANKHLKNCPTRCCPGKCRFRAMRYRFGPLRPWGACERVTCVEKRPVLPSGVEGRPVTTSNAPLPPTARTRPHVRTHALSMSHVTMGHVMVRHKKTRTGESSSSRLATPLA